MRKGEIAMYQDKTLVCKECGREFVFTAGEQEFYAEKGFAHEPQRCRECRKEARVPFQPREDRLVYCDACFASMREERD